MAILPGTVQKSLRDFFKRERERLGRTQPDVAKKGGATQGTISKIETDPEYSPSVVNFQKALAGIDHTIVSFYIQLDSLQSVHKEVHSLALTGRRQPPQDVPISPGGIDGGVVVRSSDPVVEDIRAVLGEVGDLLVNLNIGRTLRRDAAHRSRTARQRAASRKADE
jgi:transcriptional regulator with XRE-family HTH domain